MAKQTSARAIDVPESDTARLALHDCPGCGTHHALAAHTRDDGHIGWCVSCGYCGVVGPTGDGEAEAAERWNVCAATPALDDLCDETQHRVGRVEGLLGAVSGIVRDNAGGLSKAQAAQIGCVVEFAIDELSRIGGHLDATERSSGEARA